LRVMKPMSAAKSMQFQPRTPLKDVALQCVLVSISSFAPQYF